MSQTNIDDITPHCAEEKREIVQMLVEAGVDVSMVDDNDITTVFAAHHGHYTSTVLLRGGEDAHH